MKSILCRVRTMRRLGRDRRGSTAIEFALLAWPFIMLVMGGIQLAIYQYTQVTLSNALFNTASSPEAVVLSGDQAGYKTAVCAQIRIMPPATCQATILVEMAPLYGVITTPTPVMGIYFVPGTTANAMMVRAAVPAVKMLPFLPSTWAKASVVFRRP